MIFIGFFLLPILCQAQDIANPFCGVIRITDPSTQICCGDILNLRTAGVDTQCCGILAMNPATQICCGGTIFPIIGRASCCGGLAFNQDTDGCCPDGTIRSQANGGCSGFVQVPAQQLSQNQPGSAGPPPAGPPPAEAPAEARRECYYKCLREFPPPTH